MVRWIRRIKLPCTFCLISADSATWSTQARKALDKAIDDHFCRRLEAVINVCIGIGVCATAAHKLMHQAEQAGPYLLLAHPATGQSRTGQLAGQGQGGAGQNIAGQDRAMYIKAGQGNVYQGRTGPDRAVYIMSIHTRQYCTLSCLHGKMQLCAVVLLVTCPGQPLVEGLAQG